MSRRGKSPKTVESDCPRPGRVGEMGMTPNEYRVFWGGVDKNVLELIVVMVAPLCEYTENQ